MKTEVAPMRPTYTEPEIRLETLFRPYLRRWKTVAVCVAVTCAGAVAATLLPRREFKSQLVVAAVPNASSASLAGGLSSLLGNAQLGGVQSTPYFITRLLLLRSVLREVAESPADGKGGRTVIERVLERPRAEIRPQDVDHGMRQLLSTDVDKQTGLVTFAVTHPDSALTRLIAERIVAAAGHTYVRVLRSQASEQRESGEGKVDSTRRQLANAEGRLQEFSTSHRFYAPYSAAAMDRQRIERDVNAAQSAYADAVSDRQRAIGRELEESPAVVVVDPIPADLLPESRQGVLKLLLAVVLGVVVATLILVIRGEFTQTAEAQRSPVRAAA